MRVLFAGTPEFAAVALRRLLAAGFQVPLVLTQPDRPAGRGMALTMSAVKHVATEHAIAVAQPRSLRLDGRFAADAVQAQDAIARAEADLMVVVAYGLLLPLWVLDAFAPRGVTGERRHGCLNIHASLLPRWRGAAPIHRAIEAGDEKTGVCIMQMDAGLDTGAVVLSDVLNIHHRGEAADTCGSLHDRLAVLGADLIVQALGLAQTSGLVPQAQATAGVCYAHKISKHDARIDWAENAETLERRVRAFSPAPGAWTEIGSEVMKIWRSDVLSQAAPDNAKPGQIVHVSKEGVDVACGTGVLRLRVLQRAGGRQLAAADFLRGHALQPGQCFNPALAQHA